MCKHTKRQRERDEKRESNRKAFSIDILENQSRADRGAIQYLEPTNRKLGEYKRSISHFKKEGIKEKDRKR